MAVFRFPPRMGVGAYRTFQVVAPVATHWRRATCAEVDCPDWVHGFTTTVPAGSDSEDALKASGRRWASVEALPDGMVRYVFPPGTECFRSSMHKTRTRDDSLWVVRDGDHRGNPTGMRRTHARPQDWVDEFANHQDNINTTIRRG